MSLTTLENPVEASQPQCPDLAPVMRELGETELALVGGGTGAVIWA